MDTLAMLLLAAGETEQALEISERAIDRAPELLELQLNHAEILAANGDTDKARKFLEGRLRKTRDPASKQQIQLRLERL